jgi:signal transduction histidine kinase/CheY-like chemotaxis protein
MHPLLSRQVRRHFGGEDCVPGNFRAFLETIDRSYQLSDADRRMLERSLELTSEEFVELSRRLRAQLEERTSLENQLVHAQKMEAVGRLAGGIAHDFNNMLMAILGFTELALMKLPDGHPVRACLENVRAAGERSATLTRQLLAFSRKQPVAKRVVGPAALLWDMEKILRRVLGEDVSLTLHAEEGAGNALIDPSQFEQVVMNLAVNARDAMPGGGRLAISVGRVDLDDSYRRGRLVSAAGPYVLVSVTDTGTGMDQETMARMFEPFFTTKGQGKGTGLGLATVYAIARDAGGGVWANSAPGCGTTFKVCFPRVDEEASAERSESRSPISTRGNETVLLVEDEDLVRSFASQALGRDGYRVLQAPNAETALDILADPRAGVDLVVTDVVMPGLNGRELVERARATRPGLKAIYMSGYTAEITFQRGVSAEDPRFLQKPFRPDELSRRVRQVLDGAEHFAESKSAVAAEA